jgi:hypothetical protein
MTESCTTATWRLYDPRFSSQTDDDLLAPMSTRTFGFPLFFGNAIVVSPREYTALSCRLLTKDSAAFAIYYIVNYNINPTLE